MISTYLDQHGVLPTALPDKPFMLLALRQHRAARRVAAEQLAPRRVEFS
jgi:hypothetical protein